VVGRTVSWVRAMNSGRLRLRKSVSIQAGPASGPLEGCGSLR